MGESSHWPQHRTPVRNEQKQNQRCVPVWDSRFSWLFVYVRGKICTLSETFADILQKLDFFVVNLKFGDSNSCYRGRFFIVKCH